MGYVVSVRIPDREAWERAKRYARKEEVSTGKIVLNTLELYTSRDDRILKELKELKAELKRLAYSGPTSKPFRGEALTDGRLPSYFKDNPWVEILARRGLEE